MLIEYMNEKKISAHIVSPVQSDPQHKSYYCPHCKKMIMKGNVKRLSMTCPHCSDLIDADEEDLIKTKSDEA
jgi:DNA-directed RNA polymerase subunit RPC12/RpoP